MIQESEQHKAAQALVALAAKMGRVMSYENALRQASGPPSDGDIREREGVVEVYGGGRWEAVEGQG